MMTSRIRPKNLAFDIDVVVADTMEVFVNLAHERYGLSELTKEHMVCYNLHQCLDLDSEIIDELVCLTLDDEHTELIPPVAGAVRVLTELAQYGPLRFVTARIWPESIIRWLHNHLPDVPPEHIRVVATGAPEAKLQILKDMQVTHFLEDRLETCTILAQEGIQPLIFDQPWNRSTHQVVFPRVTSWHQLQQWILPGETTLR